MNSTIQEAQLGDPPESATSPRATRSGLIVGSSYRLLKCIGRGGMGEVYEAQHLRLGRRFAVKVLPANSSPSAEFRFRREAEAIARVDSEYVVSVVDCGAEADGTRYLVMDLLRGEDLRSLLGVASPLPVPRAVALIWDACQGVAAVHRAGLIHRDLKPENLFVTRRSTGEDWCKILDFGVAKIGLFDSTAEGVLVGTIRYMAPEQLHDGASVGPQVDIYALGAILYECLCGRSPHSGVAVQELMFKIMNEEVQELQFLRPEVPVPLARAIARALCKSPAQRFDDVEMFARALAPFARPGAFSSADRVDTAELQPAIRSHRHAGFNSALVTLSGLLALGLGATVALTARPNSLPSIPPHTLRERAQAINAASFPSNSACPAGAQSPREAPPPLTSKPVTVSAAAQPLPAEQSARASSRAAVASWHAPFDTKNPY